MEAYPAPQFVAVVFHPAFSRHFVSLVKSVKGERYSALLTGSLCGAIHI
jgi:hypothetical protein